MKENRQKGCPFWIPGTNNVEKALFDRKEGQPLWPLYRCLPPPRCQSSSLFFAHHQVTAQAPAELAPALLAYTRGLITCEYVSLTGIQMLTGCALSDLRDALELLDAEGVYTAQTQGLEPGGRLLIDDVAIAKEHTTATAGVSRIHCTSQKRQLDGQDFVSWLYVAPSGKRTLVRIQQWLEGGPTRIQLAQAGIARLLELGLKPLGVAFDNGFLEPKFCRWLSRHGLIWVSRVRSNQVFWFGNQERALREWAKALPLESWHYYGRRRIYAKGILISNQDFGVVKVVAVKWDRSAPLKSFRYYLTNATDASVLDILAWYRVRWCIEVCFRDCRQSLGMDQYRFTTLEKVQGHMALVAVAYNFLQSLAHPANMAIGQLKRLVQGKPAKPRRTRVTDLFFVKRAS